MSIIVRDGTNTPRTLTGIVVRDGGNVSRTITSIYVRDTGNVSHLVYSTATPLSAVASDYDVFGYDSGTGTANSTATTITPSGGTAPYTYAWVCTSYSGGVIPTASAPTVATTLFIQTVIGPGDYIYTVWQCTVTDAVLATTTVDVNANFYSVA